MAESETTPEATRLPGVDAALAEACKVVALGYPQGLVDEKLLLLCTRLSEQLLVAHAMIHDLRARVKKLEGEEA